VLSPDTLRQHFSDQVRHALQPWPGAARAAGAAVLIALQPSPAGLQILLTRRTEHLYHHPGQISLPGGRAEAHDAGPADTALREAEEEIGLPAATLEVLGQLPEFDTSTGFRVTPVVALAPAAFEVRLDSFEVAELFSLPLSVILRPANFQRHRVERGELVRHFLAVPYGGRFIWGATAGILASFAQIVGKQETL
jgi:8-oxo-dGTP pyrophosphatase MutT (NUDIX family)